MTTAPPPSSADPDRRPLGWASTLGIVALLGVVAFVALPRTIQPGDAGEFATVMLRGGVPHPSGYPWMRLLGLPARGLWALGLPPALAAALPCAVLGIAGWAWLQRTIARVCDAPRTAAFAVGLVATSPPVVIHTNDSEVWGPLVLFAAWILHETLVRRSGPLRLGAVFGLGLSHHLTIALLLPILVGAAWPRPFGTARLLRAAGLGIAGGLLGLLPYLTLMIAPEGAWSWGDTGSWSGLLHHVSRADYGVLALSLHDDAIAPAAQLARAAQSLGSALSAGLAVAPALAAALLVLVVVVAAASVPSSPTGSARPIWIGVIAATLATGLGFPLAQNIDPTSPFGAWILERFDILSLVLLALLTAVALGRGLRRIASAKIRTVLGVGGVVLVLRQTLLTLAGPLPSGDTMIERYAVDLLRTPEPDAPALVFGTDDHRTFGVLFAQEVLGEGSDVIYVDASLLAHAWYRERIAARLPGLPVEDMPLRMLGRIWEDPAWRDIPVYLANDFSRPSTRLPRVPEGILWRVLPPWGLRIPQAEVVRRHEAALQRYGSRAPVRVGPGHPFASDLAAAYLEKSQRLAEALAAQDAAP